MKASLRTPYSNCLSLLIKPNSQDRLQAQHIKKILFTRLVFSLWWIACKKRCLMPATYDRFCLLSNCLVTIYSWRAPSWKCKYFTLITLLFFSGSMYRSPSSRATRSPTQSSATRSQRSKWLKTSSVSGKNTVSRFSSECSMSSSIGLINTSTILNKWVGNLPWPWLLYN